MHHQRAEDQGCHRSSGQAQAEQREILEENFKKLEAKFDEKHQDTEPAKREDLQKQLKEKFDQVRAQLDAKQEADRQRTIEDLERIRS